MQRVVAASAKLRDSQAAGQLRSRLDLVERRRIIRSSPYFDPKWYLAEHHDVRSSDLDALEHFVLHGEAEGRDPGPDFDTDGYVWLNPMASGAALTHYHRALSAAGLTTADLVPLEVADITHPAINEGWIDGEWYRHRGPSASNRVHPWLEYRRSGGDPSPVFDDAEYRSRMPADDDRPAVENWLDRQTESALGGDQSGPLVVSRPDHRSRPLVQHAVLPRPRLAEASVAVMIHAFYPELVAGLLDRLHLLPAPPALLVSVTNREAAITVHATIDDLLGRQQQRIVKVVPNRGRNFAPLLVSFAEELVAHDVVLHMHTKRSLYTGSDRNEWRDHLIRGLLRSSATIDAILSLLATDTAAPDTDETDPNRAAPVGVVHPPIWPGMPHWAHHWLANSVHGQELYDQLGVTDRRAAGHVVYPVGGMFWARTDALRPLLDLQLGVTAFEREAGQTDRTLAHAIERAVPAAARVAGFDTVEVDLDEAQWRRNWGRDLRESSGRSEALALVGPLRESLEAASLVSVDLFDTLLLRPSLDPDRIHDLLGMELESTLEITPGTGKRLVDARLDSERRARQAEPAPGDVGLEQIYELAALAAPDDADMLSELHDAERAIERRLAIGRSWLIDLLRQHRSAYSTRMVLMTDTTLPRSAIDALLEDIAASDLFDAVYVSSELGARKDGGTMWDLVGAAERVDDRIQPGAQWLHIGDNAFSDIQQAGDRGLRWMQIPAPASHVERSRVPAGRIDLATRPGAVGAELVAGLGLASLAANQRPGTTTQLDTFGHGVLGPITYTFVDWLLRSAAERGIDRLLFTARDGALAQRMLHQVRSMRSDPIPHDEYFHISRRLTLGLLQHGGPRLDAVFAAGEFSGTVGDLFAARLGFELPGPGGAALSKEHVDLPAGAERLRDALAPFEALIRVQGTAELTGFRRYLAELGVGPDEHLGLVDLGYGGTAQTALSQVMDQQITGFYYVTSPAAEALGDAALSCFGRNVTFDDSNLIYENNLVFESLCSAAHPQVASITLDGSVSFAPGTEIESERMQEIVLAQDAAMSFASDLAHRFGRGVFDLPVDPALVHEALAATAGVLYDQPRQAFQHLVSTDLFCGRDQAELASFVPAPWPAPSPEHRVPHL